MTALRMTGNLLRQLSDEKPGDRGEWSGWPRADDGISDASYPIPLPTSASDVYELVPVEVVDGIALLMSKLQGGEVALGSGELNLQVRSSEFSRVVGLVAQYAREVRR